MPEGSETAGMDEPGRKNRIFVADSFLLRGKIVESK